MTHNPNLESSVEKPTYSQKFLHPKNRDSYSFLEECTYHVDLRSK
jgi:hypothetical protein